MNRQGVLSYLADHKEELTRKYHLSKILLFGSVAKGEETERSDVDIAVETDITDYFALYDLKESLENALGAKVDLVRPRERMNPALRRRIENEAIRVYDKSLIVKSA